MPHHQLTRRALLRLGAIGLGAAGVEILGACREPTAAPAATAPPTRAALPGTIDPLARVTPKLATLEEELALPAAVVDAARREGRLVFTSAIDKEPIRRIFDAFRKRYAGIEPMHQEASNEEVRTVRTLTEFKAGRNRIDVVMGIGGFLAEYKEAKATSSLADLPALANYEPPFRDPDAEWAGVRMQFWGIGQNTERVKAAELPPAWEALAEPRWRGRIGLANRPQLWVQQLWKVWGAARTTDFLTRLFANGVQRRNESLDAAANILAAGEFDLFVPASTARMQSLKDRGAPVSWYSPEPLTVSTSEMVILPRSPSPNAARVFVNWFLSREGQDTYARADSVVPPHPVLRSDRGYLGAFADAVVGKSASVRIPDDEQTVLPDVRKAWNQLWTG